MNDQDKAQFLEQALELAKKAYHQDEVPIGAVIVRDGKIIGSGYNQKETNHDPTSHAEIIAIREATSSIGNWRLPGCVLFTTLEPCLMCLMACLNARIKHVIYGARDQKGGALSLKYDVHQDSRFNHQFEVQYFESIECSKILSDFFKKKRTEGDVSGEK